MNLYARVLRYLAPYKSLVVAAIATTAIFSTLDAFSLLTFIPFLNALFGGSTLSLGANNARLQRLLDGTVGRFIGADVDPYHALRAIIVFMMIVFVLKNLFDWLQQLITVRIEQKVTRDMRNDVYGHLLRLDMRFFGRTRAGQVITRLTGDVDRLRTLITRNISKAVTSVFQIVATVTFMVAISWQLSLLALVALPAMFAIWMPLIRRLKRGDRGVLELAADVTSHIQETVFGIRLVKSFAAEDYERGRFYRLSQRYYRKFVRTDSLRAAAGPMTELMAAFGTMLLLWFGARLVLRGGSLGAPAFIGFLGLSTRLYAPAKWLSKFRSMIGPGLAAAERIFEFMDAPIEITERERATEFEGEHETIRFEGVRFSYEPAEPVLEDVNFEVRRGEVVALVGPSGAGKTTMVDLLARFYDPTGGRITIDGVDLRDYSIQSLRSKFGIVTQETVLFHDTVRANIAYAAPDATDEDIERAATAAHAAEFIRQLPDGYDTVLGERGTRLSGGQRQRIAIARAILRDPPILIFDEATSSLDTESEKLVQDAINRLLEGRTVFVIAHRLSTIRHADRILVIKSGRIVESGRHEELLVLDGTYRQLYELQFADV